MKIIILIGILCLPLTLRAQMEQPDKLLLATTEPKDTWYDLGKKAELKELKMQVEYVLTRRDSTNYVFIVDGEHLPLKSFKAYKESILKQAKSIYFVQAIDEIMGYPSSRKRALVLITTTALAD